MFRPPAFDSDSLDESKAESIGSTISFNLLYVALLCDSMSLTMSGSLPAPPSLSSCEESAAGSLFMLSLRLAPGGLPTSSLDKA